MPKELILLIIAFERTFLCWALPAHKEHSKKVVSFGKNIAKLKESLHQIANRRRKRNVLVSQQLQEV